MDPTLSTAPATPATPSWSALRRVAPWWHTALLVIFILGMSATSSQRMSATITRHGRLAMYVPTIIVEWLMVLYVVWGMRKTGTKVREVIGGKWETPEDFLLDFALAVGTWIVIIMVLAVLALALGLTKGANIEEAKKSIYALLPQTGAEIAAWTVLCATAGFCEELIFRGYLLRQFGALFGAMWLGVAAQAVVFGLAHGYEGWQRMVLIAVEGVVLAALALWRKSLRPGMGAHFTQDFVSGMLGRVAGKLLK
ncbi:MAG TPA: CPBP family intramembrane glutamic endopeptidase [Terriglobales bacterium]|nr:CPBP family intramembrane glutamic endopeptidase [Terriglobales bacterium]